MSAKFTALRSQIEHTLASRGVSAPFAYHEHVAKEYASTGIDEVDLLTGGFPRGALTEIYGPPYSGRTTLMISALRQRTLQAESCALIDAGDAFDPCRAAVSGVDLKQLLWVRCRNFNHAVRAADLLLHAGGFSFVCLDVGGIPREKVRKLPLDAWFRFRRAVENTSTIFLALEQEANAKTCASLVLKLEAGAVHWASPQRCQIFVEDLCQSSFSLLLNSVELRANVLRSRMNPVHRMHVMKQQDSNSTNSPSNSNEIIFRANAMPGMPHVCAS